jgi:zinc protease
MRAALLAIVLAAAAAHAGADGPLAHEELRLANGLRVFIVPDHRAPQAAVLTWVRVGSGDEAPGHTGLAHLFEHLMFKGSPHAADGLLDRLVEEQGGWTNADTDADRTLYSQLASAAFLPRALWLEADRLAGVGDALDQAKLDNQREVVLNERREVHENQPYGMAEILINEALWPVGHPYHAAIIGDPADLRAARLDDARGFFRAWYAPGNAVLAVAGDVDPATVRALVSRDFGWLPARARPAPATASAAPLAPLTRALRVEAVDDVQATRVYLTWRGVAAFDPDEPALELTAALLAGGKASRLYQRLVVDERLVQDVFAGHHAGARGGDLQVAATVKPGVDPARVIAAVDEELGRVGEADELERARNVHEAAFLAGLATPLERAALLLEYAVVAGDPDYLERDLARFRAVTPADVRRVVAARLGPEARVILTIGPRADAKEGRHAR